MIKCKKGFSLIELLIVMVIMGFVLAGTSQMFVSLLTDFKKQSKIAESNIEGIIGLEMLRRNIESAGYGLPHFIGAAAYQEAANAVAADYNDAPNNPPRAFVAGDGITAAGYVNGSDYLVIKAINVAMNETCAKWTDLITDGTATTTIWSQPELNLIDTDRVIVIAPGSPTAVGSTAVTSNNLILSTPGSFFFTQFSNLSAFSDKDQVRIVYGVDPDTDLRMAFNRADFFVSTTTDPSGRCAPGTGILKKAVVNHTNGGFNGNTYELLDCVADMQVVFGLDRTGDGTADAYSPVLTDSMATPLTAQQIREQLKEVRVYILTHEGQRDRSYVHSPTDILVGEAGIGGRTFNIGANVNYRWKVYTLNMRMLL